MNILLVDDSRMFRAYMKEVLIQMGHTVACARDGEAGLRSFARKIPDLVLLDVEMPVLNGYQVARKIREHDKMHWLPIIFISSLISDKELAKAIEVGGDDYLLKPCSATVLKAKILAMQRLADMRRQLISITADLKVEVQARKRSEEKLLHLSMHDPLTGLPNRRMYQEYSEQMLQHAKHHERKLAFLALDLDHFKQVNDNFGHDQGDSLLLEASRRFKCCIHEEDLLARIGGDEFLMLLNYRGDRSEVNLICQRILNEFKHPFALEGGQADVGVSIGVSYFPENGDNRLTLQKKADVALYCAKQSGRNCAQDYSDAMGDQLKSRRFIDSLQHNSTELVVAIP